MIGVVPSTLACARVCLPTVCVYNYVHVCSLEQLFEILPLPPPTPTRPYTTPPLQVLIYAAQINCISNIGIYSSNKKLL